MSAMVFVHVSINNTFQVSTFKHKAPLSSACVYLCFKMRGLRLKLSESDAQGHALGEREGLYHQANIAQRIPVSGNHLHVSTHQTSTYPNFCLLNIGFLLAKMGPFITYMPSPSILMFKYHLFLTFLIFVCVHVCVCVSLKMHITLPW